MDSDRIKELQEQTAYPESLSVYKALLQVWNECQQEYNEQEEREQQALFINGVGSTFAVEFAQYIAEEHFRLVNVQNGTYYWKDETSLRTTVQLYNDFKANDLCSVGKCEHKNIDRQDGCDECLDCGVRNY
jgi:hypothetical protein